MPTVRAVDDRIVPATGGTTPVSRALRAGHAGQGLGIGLGLLSAMCFGTSGTFGAALEGAGWSPAGAVLARVLVAALALTVPALFALHGRWALLRRSWRQVVLYGLVGVAACQVCYFNAIARMDVGISILLEYLGIVLVVGWLWLRHGQRPRLLTVLGGVAALGGLARCYVETGAIEQAKRTLAMVPEGKRNEAAVAAARAALEVSEQALSVGPIAELERRVAADPLDHQARFDLAVALNAKGRRIEAVDRLIEIVRRDRKWKDDGARKQLVQFFEAWGPTDEATVMGRKRLSSILFA